MKKLIIAGGGISGLSAGIFAQAAGIHTMILEKNRVPGGLCTGWNRYGFHIDGCIRELAGFRPDGELFRLFRLTGALEDTWLRRPPVILTVEHQGEVLQVYRDREAFLDELTWASREDRDRIRALGELLEAAGGESLFPGMPPDLYSPGKRVLNIWEKKRFLKGAGKLEKMGGGQFREQFRSPLIRHALEMISPEPRGALSLIRTLAALQEDGGGYPAGGSRAMVRRMEKRYGALGGTLLTGRTVTGFRMKDSRVTGVETLEGETLECDYLVTACDVHQVLYRLFRGKYPDSRLDSRLGDPGTYPLHSGLYLAAGTDAPLKQVPASLVADTEPFPAGIRQARQLVLRHYPEEEFAPEGKSVITGLIPTGREELEYWSRLRAERPREYRRQKDRTGQGWIRAIEARYPRLKGRLMLLDVATPATYERSVNSRHGSWTGFVPGPGARNMVHDGRLRGVDNLYMAGQWLLPPGGIPAAVLTGKWAVDRICRREKLVLPEDF